ncbi:MAG: hypothetical protein OYI31_06670 [Chloroflexota bacterium]|nr:hypothetical protein [Chloroflexota bacterium]MDE2941465.1 hypothetical protein [Chloroflexota bacterium]MDE3268111.1 hypothetical protein [Chloroflexota bacterium]
MRRFSYLGTTLGILGLAVAGVLYALGAREALPTENERFIAEGEWYSASSPGLYPDFSVEEVARMSKLFVVGTVGTGRFLKKDFTGEEVMKGTPTIPISLWYYAQFHVTQYLKGSGPDQITVALPAEPDGSSVVVREDVRLLHGNTYLLSLLNKEGYDEWYLGPNVYRVYEGGYGKWKVVGETAVSDDGRDVAMSLDEIRGKVDASCSTQVRPEFEAVILQNQYCP